MFSLVELCSCRLHYPKVVVYFSGWTHWTGARPFLTECISSNSLRWKVDSRWDYAYGDKI